MRTVRQYCEDRAREHHITMTAENLIDEVRAENKALKKFAREFIKTKCWDYEPEVDGDTVQEVAERCGLVKSRPATEEDAKESGRNFEVGDPYFIFTDILKEE